MEKRRGRLKSVKRDSSRSRKAVEKQKKQERQPIRSDTAAAVKDGAQQKFHSALKRYERIVSATPDHISLLDRNYIYQFVNDSYLAAHGKTRDQIVGHSVSELLGAEVFERVVKEKLDRCLGGATIAYEAWFDFAQQGRRYMSVTYYPDHAHDGKIQGVVVSSRDITDLKRAEDFVNDVLQSVDEGFIVIGRDYRIVSANKAYCDLMKLRREDVIGRFCYEVSHRNSRPCHEEGEDCAVMRSFATGEPGRALHVHTTADGTENHVQLKSFPLRDSIGMVTQVIEVIHDVTEKRKLEAQLRHAQKMEAVGTLAGGIAHDFNNFLTVIMGYGSMLDSRLTADGTGRAYLDSILATAERASHLVRRLLAFSRRQVMDIKPVDLNDTVEHMEKLLLRVVSEDTELRIIRSHAPLTVLADRGQVEQVLMNLVSNSRDAMPEGGRITISTSMERLGPEFEKKHGFGSPGTYAVVTVADDGSGIREEDRQRIFEPFYTTKGIGRGTGLGLSIVYGIIKQHSGYITVDSEIGKGTTFQVYLPTVAHHSEEHRNVVKGPPQGGGETVLVAEDDRTVRNLTCHILESHGYRVIEASDGADAVKKFAEHHDRISLALLDVLMPKMNGRNALEEIRKIQPEIKALFFSGYAQELIGSAVMSGQECHFIQKPVAPGALLAKIRSILDA